MSISDNSGRIATRASDQQGSAPSRAEVTRPGGDSARYEAIDIGGSPAPPDQGEAKPLPPAGSGPEGDPRPCAYVITYEEWATAGDERVCPECGPLDGAWFEVGTGPQPPLHDHCRCYRFVVWWDCYQSDGSWEKGGRPF
jgi:hypothetical protein